MQKTGEEMILEAFGQFRPHIAGHNSAIELFFKGLEKIKAESVAKNFAAITDAQIEKEFPITETYTESWYAIQTGKRLGAKWMRDYLFENK